MPPELSPWVQARLHLVCSARHLARAGGALWGVIWVRAVAIAAGWVGLWVVILALAGCTLWPSTWRLGGSPLDKQVKTQQQLAVAQGQAVAHAQAAVHKAGTALEAAPADNRPVALARDLVAEAQSLLDQAKGAP
ncbi:MAG: hypothetical protein FJ399_00390, partial [Verrucomicrobia bacterium]|nr:hypothetical protein [Verrucomicrobiota bacterium]